MDTVPDDVTDDKTDPRPGQGDHVEPIAAYF
jgi:hypothetical protein